MNTTTLILETERKFPSHLLPISLCLCEPFMLGFGRVTVNNKSYFVACLNVTPATFEMIRLTVKKINWVGKKNLPALNMEQQNVCVRVWTFMNKDLLGVQQLLFTCPVVRSVCGCL